MSDLKQKDLCERCDGDGIVADGPMKTRVCPKCQGKGKVEVEPQGSHFHPGLIK